VQYSPDDKNKESTDFDFEIFEIDCLRVSRVTLAAGSAENQECYGTRDQPYNKLICSRVAGINVTAGRVTGSNGVTMCTLVVPLFLCLVITIPTLIRTAC